MYAKRRLPLSTTSRSIVNGISNLCLRHEQPDYHCLRKARKTIDHLRHQARTLSTACPLSLNNPLAEKCRPSSTNASFDSRHLPQIWVYGRAHAEWYRHGPDSNARETRLILPELFLPWMLLRESPRSCQLDVADYRRHGSWTLRKIQYPRLEGFGGLWRALEGSIVDLHEDGRRRLPRLRRGQSASPSPYSQQQPWRSSGSLQATN